MMRNDQDGFTLIELLVVVAIIGILVAITVPGLLRSRIAANEASAVATVRAVSSANVAYNAICGGYAITFVTLSTNGYLPEPLTGNPATKQGYTFTLATGAGGVPAGSGVGMCVDARTAFFASARPQSSTNGRRAFALREPGLIFQDVAGNAIADPPVLGGTVTILQ